MRKILLSAVIGYLLIANAQAANPPLPPTIPEKVGFSSEALKRIDTFFDREIEAGRIPGAVIGIARDGKLVTLKAYGYRDKDKGLKMEVDSIFGLASMTKPQVAVGVLALTQRGLLPLNSPLASYFPAVADMKVAIPAADGSLRYEAQKHPITIQDLLRHTSGLTYGGRPDSSSPVANLYPPGNTLAALPSSQAFMDKITKLPLVYQPGTVWEYSVSFDVLAAVTEKVSGKKMSGYLGETIWKPLGMVDTGFHIDPAKRDRVARPLPNDPLTGKPQHIGVIEEPVNFECGGGCSVGTVPDFLRFGQMLLNGGSLDGKRVLSPEMVKLMTSNHLSASIKNNVANIEPHRAGYGFGLGVAVRVEPGIAAVPASPGEFTWNGAYGTGFWVDPQQRLVVVFGTAAPGEIRKYYREQVQDLVYGAMTR